MYDSGSFMSPVTGSISRAASSRPFAVERVRLRDAVAAEAELLGHGPADVAGRARDEDAHQGFAAARAAPSADCFFLRLGASFEDKRS